LPWDQPGGLALEKSDGGLAKFLAHHRACDGGIDVRPVVGRDGSMIRVTCTRCGRAIEALASSWEGWSEERMRDAVGPSRRFEPRSDRLGRGRGTTPPPPVESDEASGAAGWRRVLVSVLVFAWFAVGLLLMGSAISH